ncbi:DUF4382 domain-containing protein [Natronoarchaeum philippinense]|nr:DUF4382 domain-containing protein [Natronoarchaeum philippinense]
MTRHRSDADGRSDEHSLPRRAVLAAGGAAGATLVAGCTGMTGNADDGNETGAFQLLVTDLPADIGDFDSLEVTLDRARVFKGSEDGSSDESGDEAGENDSDDATNTSDAEAANGSETESGGSEDDGGDGADAEGNAPESGGGDRAFFWLDLEGETVDLTQVVGDKAVSVFEGELETGTYSKVELHAADIEGIVDGEQVDVKLPSGKLQIVHEFEVQSDESVEFVFDIHVVKKGNGGYNLRPVVSGSGVNGADVDVEEIDPENSEASSGANESSTDGGANESDAETGGDQSGSGTGGDQSDTSEQ